MQLLCSPCLVTLALLINFITYIQLRMDHGALGRYALNKQMCIYHDVTVYISYNFIAFLFLQLVLWVLLFVVICIVIIFIIHYIVGIGLIIKYVKDRFQVSA